MSVWGKIIGGAAGFFALGGPLGALLGALAGHAIDKQLEEEALPAAHDDRRATREIAFTIAVIALGAKMAKADGTVSRSEVAAFKQVFKVPTDELNNVARVFDQAKRDVAGFDAYARQLANMFDERHPVLEELIDGLFHIARADGEVHDSEIAYIREVARIFGFTDADFARMREVNVGPDHADPYTVLGVRREQSDDEIKASWRRLMRENHPDKLVAQGLPAEFVALANEKVATLNAAYDRIAKERGIK
ncbi:TerB family tellurite resistance protein [Dongia rigui]|uniref:TerB family tellurite resistance protein n=1 Tax=Dongia rigui TaxID=940149 RepID=A0ABU5E292_9PROT|nr:TerB family tellurite resistance protein [Dongia rigui]MDY0873713.1 TerB family tellurite resistance protein [Dongia rigui]